MFHPDILQAFDFRLTMCQTCAMDALYETADWFGINDTALRVFLQSMEVRGSERLI